MKDTNSKEGDKELRDLPLSLDKKTIKKSLPLLEQTLVDSYMIYSLYKKHHWQLIDPRFYQLHLLFDKHAGEQLELIDLLAERMQLLGGVAIAMPADITERTIIEPPPQGRESGDQMLRRLIEAHEAIIADCRKGIKETEESEDYGTTDLLTSQVLRTNELQSWFISSHLETL